MHSSFGAGWSMPCTAQNPLARLLLMPLKEELDFLSERLTGEREMKTSDRSESWQAIVNVDVAELTKKNAEYADSWKRRGGVGAFMMAARKWDRIEECARKCNWDIFEVGRRDMRPEGILDDIADLRRYLLLIEEEIRNDQDLELMVNGLKTGTQDYKV